MGNDFLDRYLKLTFMYNQSKFNEKIEFEDSIQRILNNSETSKDLIYILNVKNEKQKKLFELASDKKNKNFGDSVNLRGVIELSNICKNNCRYCSMARDNKSLSRYTIGYEDLKQTADIWLDSGIKTFHLSSGECDDYSLDNLKKFVQYLKKYDCDIILVLGNKRRKDLEEFYQAGAEYYIAKFETSNPWLYNEYNDKNNDLEKRIKFLEVLQEIGYKVGTGNIVGLPFQKDCDLSDDLKLTKSISPQFASTSSFIPNQYSEYNKFPKGDTDKTLNYIALLRLILNSNTLIPTNSSLGSKGKIAGLYAGANLLNINLTPEKYLYKYIIYDEQKRKKANLQEVYKFVDSIGLKIRYKII